VAASGESKIFLASYGQLSLALQVQSLESPPSYVYDARRLVVFVFLIIRC
jgi:hypothetical protein